MVIISPSECNTPILTSRVTVEREGRREVELKSVCMCACERERETERWGLGGELGVLERKRERRVWVDHLFSVLLARLWTNVNV